MIKKNDDINWISLEETEDSKKFREWVEYLEQLIIKHTIMDKFKIPASHLRAGNFHVGKDFSIPRLGFFSMKIDDHSFHSITIYGITLVETGLVEFNPIELSENWLKKFGFKESSTDDPDIKNWTLDNLGFVLFKTTIGTKSIYYRTRANESIQIKWVHQLQNLYFALYQKELELIKENA